LVSTENNYAFGSFILRTDPLRLLRDGVEVPLGARALAILHALVRHPGQALSKQRLIELVWPGASANDNSVHVHINTLRNRVGHELIVTVAGAGYRLNAPVRAVGRTASAHLAAGGERGRLFGREAEATELAELVACRTLVTVTGPGGCGKSALARALVGGSAVHTDVACVDVGALDDATQLAAAVTAAARIAPPQHESDTEWRLQLGSRDLLLVLDNCERHVAAVADLCAHLALTHEGLRVLATSQVPLQIAGEWTLRLGGLAMPPEDATLDEARDYSSVRLLVERATQQQRGFTLNAANAVLIVQLVRLADGMPLAIELMAQRLEGAGSDAAALGRLLVARSAADALQRRDAPARQQSLHASLQWSLALLSAAERDTLTQLAVFEGGFAPASAVAVTAVHGDADTDADAVVHAHLAALVRRSLLMVDWSGPRYSLLQLVRAQLLAEPGASELRAGARQRHARCFAEYARHCREELAQRGSNPAAWRERIDGEARNLQAALDWAVGPGRSAPCALSLCADLADYWDLTGRYAQAALTIAAALQLPADEGLRPLRQRALEAEAACNLHRGRLPDAARWYGEAAAEARALGANAALLRAEVGMATCSVLQGDIAAAEALLQPALAGFEALRDRDGIANCHRVRTLICIERDELERAQACAEEALDAARAGGALTTAAEAHALLGQVMALSGEALAAPSHLQAAIDLATYLGFVRPRAQAACTLAAVIARQGERAAAVRQLAGALRAALQVDLGIALPQAVLTAAQLLAAEDDAVDVLSLVSAVDAARSRGDVHLAPWLHRWADELRQRAGLHMDAAQIEVARTRGQSLLLPQAGWHAVAALELQAGSRGMLPFRRRARRAAPADEELRESAAGER